MSLQPNFRRNWKVDSSFSIFYLHRPLPNAWPFHSQTLSRFFLVSNFLSKELKGQTATFSTIHSNFLVLPPPCLRTSRTDRVWTLPTIFYLVLGPCHRSQTLSQSRFDLIFFCQQLRASPARNQPCPHLHFSLPLFSNLFLSQLQAGIIFRQVLVFHSGGALGIFRLLFLSQ